MLSSLFAFAYYKASEGQQPFGGFVMSLLGPRFPASPLVHVQMTRCQLERDAYSGGLTAKTHSLLQQENPRILKDGLPFVFSHLNGLLGSFGS